MSHRIAILCITIFVVAGMITAGPVLAGKPPQPPPPMTNPAISYVAIGSRAAHQVFVMTANGAQKKELTSSKGIKKMTAWSPDGNRIAYVHTRSEMEYTTSAFPIEDLWVVNRDGTGLMNLCRLRPKSSWSYNRIDWSPDGNWIVYSAQAPTAPPPPCEWREWWFELWAVNVNDCREVRLTYSNDIVYTWPYGDTGMTATARIGASAPTWSPDLDLVTDGYQTRIAFSQATCLESVPDPCGTLCDAIDIDLMYITVEIIDGEIYSDPNQVPVPLGPLDDGATGHLDDLRERSGDWDATGSWLIEWKLQNSGSTSPFPVGTYMVSQDGTQDLFLWSGVNEHPRWSSDSAWYSTGSPASGRIDDSGVYRVRVSVSNPAPTFLTTGTYNDWNPAWVNDIGY